jgi:hypothetical protein
VTTEIDRIANMLAIKSVFVLGSPIYDTDFRALVRIVIEELREPPPQVIALLALINAYPNVPPRPQTSPDWLRDAWGEILDIILDDG